jgi:ATP-binding cassette subfamily B protein
MQEPYLFSRTIEENIGIARPDASEGPDTSGKAVRRRVAKPVRGLPDADIRSAAAAACLDETIEGFSLGYDTFVGERGVTLSGGQKQRTAIAQMLMKKPKIMVFDDSLSAVDAETDARIRRQLEERSAGTTVMLIAHRVSTLMKADNIIVLDKGRIIESGTHEELLAKGGVYSKVYELQTRQQ